ncbi:MAG: hypothetical protein M1835_004280 [Candelina submexicana]|nr:MAG: hypothetical protein M1835_004280 [Candelina submexicana]
MSQHRGNQRLEGETDDDPQDTSHSYRHRSRGHPSYPRRSRSPDGTKHPHNSNYHHKQARSRLEESIRLPFGSQLLSKHDFKKYRPLFALYLDIQKHIVLEDIDDVEARGRWKSFLGKCITRSTRKLVRSLSPSSRDLILLRNRGELAEGWYDPSTRQKAILSSIAPKSTPSISAQSSRVSPDYGHIRTEHQAQPMNESDDDAVGPKLPAQEVSHRKVGPATPGVEDLVLRQEMAREDRIAALEDIRFARKMDWKQQKEQLDELVPRADAGTRERQLERKKEINEKMGSFRDKSPGTGEEVGDQDLMGDDSIEGYKAKKKDFERKKNEREMRKEEMLRIRAAEREERFQEHRAKEDKTMAMLKSLAKQNFG